MPSPTPVPMLWPRRAGLKGIGYNEAAARRSWQHMKLFFDEIFAAK